MAVHEGDEARAKRVEDFVSQMMPEETECDCDTFLGHSRGCPLRMQEDFLSGSWCEECESPTNHTTAQHRAAESERLECEAEWRADQRREP